MNKAERACYRVVASAWCSVYAKQVPTLPHFLLCLYIRWYFADASSWRKETTGREQTTITETGKWSLGWWWHYGADIQLPYRWVDIVVPRSLMPVEFRIIHFRSTSHNEGYGTYNPRVEIIAMKHIVLEFCTHEKKKNRSLRLFIASEGCDHHGSPDHEESLNRAQSSSHSDLHHCCSYLHRLEG